MGLTFWGGGQTINKNEVQGDKCLEKRNDRRQEMLGGERGYNFRSGVPRGFLSKGLKEVEELSCVTSWERMFQAEGTANAKTQRHVCVCAREKEHAKGAEVR